MSNKRALVVCSNGVIAAWHPKPTFSYEYSRPINLEEVNEERESATFEGLRMLKCYWFGRVSYANGLRIQDHVIKKLKSLPDSSACQYVCFFEHHPVYTVGLRHYIYSETEESRLRNTGADFFRVKRGGLITFHGPGQLVAYPVFNLRTLPKLDADQNRLSTSFGVRVFVNKIEETIISLLTEKFGIKNVGRTPDTGVWVKNDRKVAAIGIQVQSGITSHGVALNCNTDLNWFQQIVPCGLEGKTATSISKELGVDTPIANVLEPMCRSFQSTFHLPSELYHSPITDETVDEFLTSNNF